MNRIIAGIVSVLVVVAALAVPASVRAQSVAPTRAAASGYLCEAHPLLTKHANYGPTGRGSLRVLVFDASDEPYCIGVLAIFISEKFSLTNPRGRTVGIGGGSCDGCDTTPAWGSWQCVAGINCAGLYVLRSWVRFVLPANDPFIYAVPGCTRSGPTFNIATCTENRVFRISARRK